MPNWPLTTPAPLTWNKQKSQDLSGFSGFVGKIAKLIEQGLLGSRREQYGVTVSKKYWDKFCTITCTGRNCPSKSHE